MSLLGGVVLRALGDAGYTLLFLGSSLLRAVITLRLGRGVGMRRARERSFPAVFARVLSMRSGSGSGWRPLVFEDRRRRRTRVSRRG